MSKIAVAYWVMETVILSWNCLLDMFWAMQIARGLQKLMLVTHEDQTSARRERQSNYF